MIIRHFDIFEEEENDDDRVGTIAPANHINTTPRAMDTSWHIIRLHKYFTATS
jgi:hypothetical protein